MLLHASVGLTAFDTLVTLLADYHYKIIIAIPLAIGITNAMRAFALMIGPLLISNWITKERMLYSIYSTRNYYHYLGIVYKIAFILV